MIFLLWFYIVPFAFCFGAFCIDDYFTAHPISYKDNFFYSIIPGYNFVTMVVTCLILISSIFVHLVWKVKGLV